MSKAADVVARLREAAAAERLDPAAFLGLIRDVFRTAGLSDADATTAAEVAVYGSMHGTDAHGAVQLPLYITGLLDGTIKSRPDYKISGNLPCCAVIDADHALGLVVSCKAMAMAIERAKTDGLGAVAVRNSSHFAGAGYYCDLAAKQNLVGFAFTNASPAIAPTGSKQALLGTNPIGVSFPRGAKDPIIADFATAVVARSRVRAMLALGQTTVPEGWALDAEGKPTTDAAQAVKGSILPIGGPKGYALALMVELLCTALSDCEPGFQITYENVVKRPSTIGQFFLALNPAGFVDQAAYEKRINHVADVIETAAPIEVRSPPRLPGARAEAVNRAFQKDGFLVSDNHRHALRAVADLFEKRGL
jgi:LDH2 family malate/lactate/ureidoglycolate dehydrogenase